MKSPQLENGYTKIANEIMDELCKLQLSPCEWQVLLVVLRKTYGWNKKTDKISLSQFQAMTGMEHSRLCRTIKKLVAKRPLLKTESGFSFNKCVNQWVVAKQPRGGGYLDNLVVAKQPHTKDTITKEIIGTRFTRPSLTQIREYCQAKNYTFDPEAFMAHYDSNGWKVGRNPMKCWKAACTTWQKNERKTHNKHPEQVEYPDMEAVKQWQRDIGLNPDK